LKFPSPEIDPEMEKAKLHIDVMPPSFFTCSSNIITAPFKSAGNMASSAGSAVVARIQMVGEKVRQAYNKPSILNNRWDDDLRVAKRA